MVDYLQYTVSNAPATPVEILKSEYNDFFKIGDTYARILKA
jgi:hypothetical protein